MRDFGQCKAALSTAADSNIWYCVKPRDHDGQHEALVKWGPVDAARESKPDAPN